jgi:predicted  nucleic acid-binding Zn-ribbon protein
MEITNEDRFNLYIQGIKEGQKHSTSSPETIKQLNLIKTAMSELETHLKYIKEALSNNSEEHKGIKQSLDNLENRYARKSLEDDVEGLRDEIKEMGKEKETRSYDWLKYAITTAIALLASRFIIN